MNAKKLIFGGLTLVGVTAMAAYRTYELKKLRKAIEEEQIIEIQAENVEELSQK